MKEEEDERNLSINKLDDMGDGPKRMNQREFPGGLAVKDLALPVAQVTAVGWV